VRCDVLQCMRNVCVNAKMARTCVVMCCSACEVCVTTKMARTLSQTRVLSALSLQVAKTLYIHRLFSAKEPYNSWIFCKKRPKTHRVRHECCRLWHCRLQRLIGCLIFVDYFQQKKPTESWLFCGKRPATESILCIFAAVYKAYSCFLPCAFLCV